MRGGRGVSEGVERDFFWVRRGIYQTRVGWIRGRFGESGDSEKGTQRRGPREGESGKVTEGPL